MNAELTMYVVIAVVFVVSALTALAAEIGERREARDVWLEYERSCDRRKMLEPRSRNLQNDERK